MKKLFLLSSVLLGTTFAARAGVDVHIGIGLPLPPLPRIVFGVPPPVVVPAPPAVIYRPPVCIPAPVVVAPPPVVCAPRPVILPPCARVIVAPPHAHYSHRYEYLHHHH